MQVCLPSPSSITFSAPALPVSVPPYVQGPSFTDPSPTVCFQLGIGAFSFSALSFQFFLNMHFSSKLLVLKNKGLLHHMLSDTPGALDIQHAIVGVGSTFPPLLSLCPLSAWAAHAEKALCSLCWLEASQSLSWCCELHISLWAARYSRTLLEKYSS